MRVRIAWLLFGIFACSTAVIFIKLSTVHPLLLAGYRQVMASLILLPLFLRDVRRHRGCYGLTHIGRAALPSFMLATHFASWTVGARLTSAANATLIVNLVPVVMPFLMYFVTREVVGRGEVAGTMIALAGLLVLTVGDVTFSAEHVWGDATCFVSMLLFAVYLSLARRNRDFPSIWTYVVPLYFMGGMMCFAAAATVTPLLQIFPPKEYLYLAALAVIPTIFGHSILNYSLKHMRGQFVSVCNLTQFLFAGVMGFFFFGEIPGWNFYLASILIVVGSAVAIRSFQGE